LAINQLRDNLQLGLATATLPGTFA